MFVLWICTYLACFRYISMRSIEPQCSPFDFFERTIEKVVRVEHNSELSKLEMERIGKTINDKLELFEKLFSDKVKELEEEMAQSKLLRKSTLESLEEYKTNAEDSLERQNRQFQESSSALNKQLLSFKDDLATPTIVFKAKDATESHLSNGDTIVFPTLVMNVGGGYDSSTGVFTVPTNGTYLFSVQVCLYESKYLRIRIVAADTVIAASMHLQDAYNAVCHTSDGVAVLSQREKVMVSIVSKDSGRVIYPDSNINKWWTSFSGVLIHT